MEKKLSKKNDRKFLFSLCSIVSFWNLPIKLLAKHVNMIMIIIQELRGL